MPRPWRCISTPAPGSPPTPFRAWWPALSTPFCCTSPKPISPQRKGNLLANLREPYSRLSNRPRDVCGIPWRMYMRRSSSKLRQLFMAVLFLSPLIFAFTLWPAVAYAQDVPSCTGVANIVIGSTTYAPQWCDEFTGVAGPPSTTVWNYDLGNNGGWGNGEAEVYCGPPGYAGNPSQCPTTFSTATAPVYIDGNGHLVIQVINENGAWLSGRMNTEGLENFTYGILEASIQLPNTTNQGLWPAFWTLGSDITTVPWPGCGEADIMENWSPQVDNGKGTTGDDSTIHTTKTGGDGIGSPFTFPSGEATDTAFHTYGIVWSANEMQFFVDNPASPFFTATPSILPAGDTWPFNQSIFTILNVAVGGTLGGSDAGLTSPQLMQVGYVRWYTPTGPVTCSEVPSAPTELAAAASSSSVIGLVWAAVTTPPANCLISGYNVYGSTTSGFTPSSSNLIASGLTSNNYTVTGLTDLTTYYYVVEAVDAAGNSLASNQATATTLAPGATSPEIVAIAAGGPAQSDASGGDYSFAADEDFVGGALNGAVTATINLTQPGANAAPMAVYQNGRNGTFTYTIPGLTAGAQYTVLLHFAETYFSGAGEREFDVAINGTAVLTNFDIVGTVGAENAALVKTFTATANSSGQIVIAFTNGAVNQPLLMGLEVRSTSSASCSADPSAPTGLAATASSSSAIGLTWTAVTPPANCTISGYNVYGSTTSGFTPGSGNLIASGLTGTSYTNTGLAASTTYYYVVEAVDAYGSSPASAQASAETEATATCTTVPSAPTGLTATASSSSAIGLSWTAVTPPANCTISSYNVYGSTTSGFVPAASNLIASGVTTTSYSNTGLAASTTHYYVVEAVDGDGASAASAQASAETSAASCTTVPSAPTGLTATASSSTAIALSWTAVTPPANCSISSYKVYGSTTSGFTPSSSNLITTTTSTTYSNTGLAASTTYYYVVEAIDADGSSAASTQATATTQAASGSTEVLAIACGGPAESNSSGGDYSFVADEDFSGGGDNSPVTATINLTQPGANAAPMAVYQHGRAGVFTYTIPGLTTGSTYTVLLHFAETYFTAAGGREFNVAINGTTVLTNLDIYATVGKDSALLETFTATANSSGDIGIAFTDGAANQPLVMGIEVRSSSSGNCSAVPLA